MSMRIASQRSKTVAFVLEDGTPYGVRTATLSSWDGSVSMVPRAAVGAWQTLDTRGAAIYFLHAEREQQNDRLYVGQTDRIAQRIIAHARERDFWEEAIICTSPTLGATEVRYLEHAFIARLKASGNVKLENTATPGPGTISRAVVDTMDDFADHTSDVLLALGYHFISPSASVVQRSRTEGAPVICRGPNAEAQGVYGEHGLLVFTGSTTRKHATQTMPYYALRGRERLIAEGILAPHGANQYIFTRDHLFASASAASVLVLARSSTGLRDWKDAEGHSLKEQEARGAP